jgi:pimeloyl-ACP methyl ester carboxylesterase
LDPGRQHDQNLTPTECVAACWQRRFEKGVCMPQVERSFIGTPSGRIHIASAGSGAPVLLLHQTPRSWDEFRDVLPLLGRHYRVIAMDTVGYGDSDPLPDQKPGEFTDVVHRFLAAQPVWSTT